MTRYKEYTLLREKEKARQKEAELKDALLLYLQMLLEENEDNWFKDKISYLQYRENEYNIKQRIENTDKQNKIIF